jgi:hypothetical protein
LHVQLKLHPAEYRGSLEAIPIVPRFAVSQFNDVCLFVCRETLQ